MHSTNQGPNSDPFNPRETQSLLVHALSLGVAFRNPVSVAYALHMLLGIVLALSVHWIGILGALLCAALLIESLFGSIWLWGSHRYIVTLCSDGTIIYIVKTKQRLFKRKALEERYRLVFDLTPGQIRTFSLDMIRYVDELALNRQRLSFRWQVGDLTHAEDIRTITEWLLEGLREAANKPWWNTIHEIEFIQHPPSGVNMKSAPTLTAVYTLEPPH